jgi:hypothetical protein
VAFLRHLTDASILVLRESTSQRELVPVTLSVELDSVEFGVEQSETGLQQKGTTVNCV